MIKRHLNLFVKLFLIIVVMLLCLFISNLDAQSIMYNWCNYDYGVDCTKVWDDGYFMSEDIGKTVFDSLEELEKAFPEDFDFEETC